MTQRVLSTAIERTLRAPPRIVWAIMADSNRWDRIVGMNPSVYSYELLVPGDPSSRTRVGRSRYLGFPMAWIEVGEWVEGRSVWGERRFVVALIDRAGFRFEVEPHGEGSRVSASAYLAGTGIIAWMVCLFWRMRFAVALRSYFSALDQLLPQVEAPPDDADAPPASVSANRALAGRPVSGAVFGSVAVPSSAALAAAVTRLAAAPVDADLAALVVGHVSRRPDDDLVMMRPFELARLWGRDRREVLRAFLHASRAGLVDLVWQLNCPTCRVSAGAEPTLARVDRRIHCPECDIDFDVDLAANVEAVFRPNAAIRPVASTVYCAASPWFRPHVFAQLRADPGERRALGACLPRGGLRVRVIGRAPRSVDVTRAGPQRLAVRAGEGGQADVRIEDGGGDLDELVLENDSPDQAVVLVERAGWSADVALGSVLLTMPEFLELFGTDAPAAGLELSVGFATVLFTDLTGSTALYERLGDARAFGLVQEHFRIIERAVVGHDGAVLKTMGDAVMASFTTPVDALAASFEMIDAVDRQARDRGIEKFAVKLGLHEGPCLAVRANGGIDLFGTTVNVAARLQALAEAGEVVLAAEVAALPAVAAALDAKGCTTRPMRASLKGLAAERDVVVVGAKPDGSAPSGRRVRALDESGGVLERVG